MDIDHARERLNGMDALMITQQPLFVIRDVLLDLLDLTARMDDAHARTLARRRIGSVREITRLGKANDLSGWH